MIDFSGYTMESIQAEMLGRVPDTIDKRQGSMIQTAIAPAAWYLEGLYMMLVQVQENAYANTAVGQALEYICAERGISRKPAVCAVRKGSFNVEIPEGSLFKTINGGNSVGFLSGKLIAKTDASYVYEMTCKTAGTIGNAYSGAILPVTTIAGLTEATLGEIIVHGSDEESDDSLRARYFATFEAVAFGGNLASYRNAILAITSVGAVQIYPAWQGGGTVLCSILDSELKPAGAALVSQVQNLICPPEEGGGTPSRDGYGIAPIGASVTITTASARTLNISCTVQFIQGVSASVDIYQERIEEKIEAYLASIRQTWGNAIKGQKIEYAVSVYVSRIVMAILSVEEIVNVTDVLINGAEGDLSLTETAQIQEIPILGEVTVNAS